jgi:hypothetical protein
MPSESQSKYLTDVVRKACDLDYLDSLSFGTLLRTLLDCSTELSLQQKTACIENAADALRDSGYLNSPEFYEGVADTIPSHLLLSILRTTYLDDSLDECEFCKVVSTLSSSGAFNMKKARLHSLREHMNPLHMRNLCAGIADNSCEDIHSVTKLLRRIYHPSEEYEVTEALRTMIKQDWFVDIIPRNHEKAMALFKETIIKAFPCTGKVLQDWTEGVGEDSDYETDNGSSLEDFIIDDENEDDDDDDEDMLDEKDDVSSTVSEEPPVKRKRAVVVIDSDSD